LACGVPSPQTLLTFALAGIVLVAVPGPGVLFIVCGRTGARAPRSPASPASPTPRWSCSRCSPAVLDSAWGLLAGAARSWFATSPARLRRVDGLGGLAMIWVGAGLAFTGRRV